MYYLKRSVSCNFQNFVLGKLLYNFVSDRCLSSLLTYDTIITWLQLNNLKILKGGKRFTMEYQFNSCITLKVYNFKLIRKPFKKSLIHS